MRRRKYAVIQGWRVVGVGMPPPVGRVVWLGGGSSGGRRQRVAERLMICTGYGKKIIAGICVWCQDLREMHILRVCMHSTMSGGGCKICSDVGWV